MAPAFTTTFDYGGRELDDVYEGQKWMLETYGWLDPKRVGAIGWSHGGADYADEHLPSSGVLRGCLCGGSRE